MRVGGVNPDTPSSSQTERREGNDAGNPGEEEEKEKETGSGLTPLTGEGLDSPRGNKGHLLVWWGVAALSQSSLERSEAGDQSGPVYPPPAS